MNRLLLFALISIFSIAVRAQDMATTEHPVAKFLSKHSIDAQYSLVVKPDSRKALLKEIKKTPYLEVYNKMGVMANYPSPEAHLIKSFFNPNDKSSIPMQSLTPDVKANQESILKRFINITMPDGSKISTDVIQSPDKYYVVLYWKKDSKKRNIEVLRNWTNYAKENREIKLILVNVD